MLLEKETSLTEAFIGETLSSSGYQAAVSQVRQELTELNARSAQIDVDPAALRRSMATTLSLATSVWDVYSGATDVRKGELLRAVLSAVVLGPEGILGFSLRSPFKEIAKGVPRGAREAIQTAKAIVDAA